MLIKLPSKSYPYCVAYPALPGDRYVDSAVRSPLASYPNEAPTYDVPLLVNVTSSSSAS